MSLYMKCTLVQNSGIHHISPSFLVSVGVFFLFLFFFLSFFSPLYLIYTIVRISFVCLARVYIPSKFWNRELLDQILLQPKLKFMWGNQFFRKKKKIFLSKCMISRNLPPPSLLLLFLKHSFKISRMLPQGVTQWHLCAYMHIL